MRWRPNGLHLMVSFGQTLSAEDPMANQRAEALSLSLSISTSTEFRISGTPDKIYIN